MKETIEFLFKDIWHFIGTLVMLLPLSVTITTVLNILTDFLYGAWASFMRMLMVRKHGWPTNPDLDADGNFRTTDEEK